VEDRQGIREKRFKKGQNVADKENAKQQNRKTGIDILGNVPWGTHFCLFYQNRQDLMDILVPYFKAGLENNEFCMWVTSEPLDVEDAKHSLKQAVTNLDDYIKKGQIEILDYSDWYTKSGSFKANEVLQGWVEKHDQALKREFDGLRLTGNTFWLDKRDWEKFVDYEGVVNNVIDKYKMLAICTYSLDKCSASDIIDVVTTHQFAVIRREDQWELIESSERKKAEKALEKLNKDLESTVQQLSRSNKELKNFARIIAHDLKSPLRAIGTLAAWISTDYGHKLDEQGKEQIKLLVGRAKRMSELVNGLLQYFEIGRVEKEREEVNLNTLVAEVIAQLGPPECIEITVENELPSLICDKIRLMQVFQNLLSNAVRYMDKPQGRIRIGCVEEDGLWKFSIADNRPGIASEYFEKVFKMFQTLSARDESESRGIGLTLVKKIVELNDGKIWLESKVGEGSTFLFTLRKLEMEGKDAKLKANIAY